MTRKYTSDRRRAKPDKRRVTTRIAQAKAPKKVSPKLLAAKPVNRAERAAERRGAIIEAAMEEFIARGFAATRLDDIARRAGVAKGTIYLHFKDKESMFEELIRTAHRAADRPPRPRRRGPGASVRDMVEGFAQTFIEEVAYDAARRHRAPDRRRGAAISERRRLLLPRGGFAGHRRHARADRTRHRAR